MVPSKTLETEPAVTFESGTAADSYVVFLVFEQAYADLTRRLGLTRETSIADPQKLAKMWRARRPLYEHLAATADQFWLAKRGERTVGFARSILRDRLRLMTELFVLPGEQSGGLGQQLLALAFPAEGADRRWLLATSDLRAQALYLKHGLYPHFPAYYFWRQPRELPLPESDLRIERADSSTETLLTMGDVDVQLLNHHRDVDHTWLMTDRQAYLYYRAGKPVGYGYVGSSSGPFALLKDSDFPAVLAHAEGETARLGRSHFGLEVPMVNQVAVDYLLRSGFRIDDFMAHFMTDGPLGHFDNYIMTSPPFIL
jgi:hypothetical protein